MVQINSNNWRSGLYFRFQGITTFSKDFTEDVFCPCSFDPMWNGQHYASGISSSKDGGAAERTRPRCSAASGHVLLPGRFARCPFEFPGRSSPSAVASSRHSCSPSGPACRACESVCGGDTQEKCRRRQLNSACQHRLLCCVWLLHRRRGGFVLCMWHFHDVHGTSVAYVGFLRYMYILTI